MGGIQKWEGQNNEGEGACVYVCLLPPGRMLQVGVVLVGMPQWSTCHGMTLPVAVCVCVQKKGREIWRRIGLFGNKNTGLEGEIYFSSRGLVSMLLNCCSQENPLILATIVPLRYVHEKKMERVLVAGEENGMKTAKRMEQGRRDESEEMGDKQRKWRERGVYLSCVVQQEASSAVSILSVTRRETLLTNQHSLLVTQTLCTKWKLCTY